MNSLAFIPARAGSLGIKNKNLVKLNKKPLIIHTIDFIKKFPKIDWFISTNGEKIFNVAKRKGFKFNYLRPDKISGSKSNVIDAIIHGVDWLKKTHNLTYETIILLQPTSPLRSKKEFNSAYNYFKKKKLVSLASVTTMREHPEECLEIQNQKQWKFLKQKKKNSYGRQSFSKKFFFIDGSFYIAKVDFLKKNRSFLVKNKTSFYKLKSKWPIDIDELDDLMVTEALIKKRRSF